jgi:hypothetical protein
VIKFMDLTIYIDGNTMAHTSAKIVIKYTGCLDNMPENPTFIEPDIDPDEFGPCEFGLMDEDGNSPEECDR